MSYRTGMSGGSTSDDVVAKSCDVTIFKSFDPTESSVRDNAQRPSLDPSNYSFSSLDDVFDESAASLCNTSSKSHDATAGSHDIFDSFDELLQKAHVTNYDDLEKEHDPKGDVTSGSHDITESHDQTDDITGGSHDFTRLLVLEAVMQECDGGRGREELVLRLQDQSSTTEREVYLRDEWCVGNHGLYFRMLCIYLGNKASF